MENRERSNRVAANDDVILDADRQPTTEPGEGGDPTPERTALIMLGSFIADTPTVTNRSVEDFYYFVKNSQGEETATALLLRLEDAVGRIPGGTQAYRTVQQVRRSIENHDQTKRDILSDD